MSWTDARDTRLKELCADRVSASGIAKLLNDEFKDHAPISRNAVIGRARRKGLKLRGVSTPPPPNGHAAKDIGADIVFDLRDARKIGRSARRSVGRSSTVIPLPAWPFHSAPSIVPAPAAKREKTKIADLNAFTCRWPIGDPQSPDFYFCGAEPECGKPYCSAHCRLAYYRA